MRMGIFAKRDILKGEELTFNYNVDRYGSAYYFLFSILDACILISVSYSYDAQTCYCGENGCLGTIGGKTQTDIRILDPLYIEGKNCVHVGYAVKILIHFNLALGMYDNEEDSLKGHRRRKLRTIADIDLVSKGTPFPLCNSLLTLPLICTRTFCGQWSSPKCKKLSQLSDKPPTKSTKM